MASDVESKTDGGYGIRAADRVCDILDTLAAGQQLGLGEIAQQCSLPKSSAFRYLATLEQRRYVERDPATEQYRLGTAVMSLQASHIRALTSRARPLLEELRDRLGETANLGILDGTRVAYLDIVESPRSMRMSARPGDRDMLHCTALGKIIAAQLDPERLQYALDSEGLPKRTSHTITNRARLLADLAEIKRLGYAVDDEENEVGGRCVAVAVPGPVLSALSISAPTARLAETQVPAVAAALRTAATTLAAVTSAALKESR